MKIREMIVVEGEHDRVRVAQAVEADVIVTGGSRIRKDVFTRLARVANDRGIIVLTDPDYAGAQIRKRVTEHFPQCKHAYIPRAFATHNGDIGVENASSQAIQEALAGVRTPWEEPHAVFSWADMVESRLTAVPDAARRREALGTALQIGYANGKALLKRLNALQVSRAEFEQALASLDELEDRAIH